MAQDISRDWKLSVPQDLVSSRLSEEDLLAYWKRGEPLSRLDDNDIKRLLNLAQVKEHLGPPEMVPVPQFVPPSPSESARSRLQNEAQSRESFTPEDLRAGLIAALKGTEIAAGFIPGPPGLRVLASGLASLGTGALEGEGTLTGAIKGAMTRGATNAGLQAAGEGLSEAFPRWGVKGGLYLGSLRSPLKRERIPEIADAFMRVRDKTPGGLVNEIPIGLQAVTTLERRRAGQKLAQLEESVPGRDVNFLATRGSIDDLLEDIRTGSSLPDTFTRGARKLHRGILRENLAARNWDPMMSNREAQELARGILNEPGPGDVIKARQAGQFVPAGEDVAGKVRERVGKDLRDLADIDASVKGVALRPQRQMVSDLKTMEDANRSLRGGGTTFGDLGQLGIRGGAGSAILGSILNQLGMDWRLAYGLGGMTGVMASPINISRMGYNLGRGAGALPTAVRGLDFATDIQDANEKRRVRRRQPK